MEDQGSDQKAQTAIRPPLQVFYDGACPLCSREMRRYQRASRRGELDFVDISAVDFAADEHGRSMDEFMEQMHVRDAVGNWYRGIDAFPALWSALPGWRYRCLRRVLLLPGLNFLARIGYRVFAANRHRLPGRKKCTDDCQLH